jgi:hypothetical protein
VPLLMRGPGVPKGVEVDEMAINADLPPTILDVAEARASLPQDGRSLIPLAQEPERSWGRELLIEQYSPDGEDGEPIGTEYTAVRTQRYKYVENATGELELYDLELDPYELQNQAANPAYDEIEGALAQRLAALRTCQGKSCRAKPAMDLVLPRSVRRDGGRCTPAGAFLAEVKSRAQSPLIHVTFRVNGRRVAEDGKAAFARRLPAKALRSRPRAEIEADAELLDGRVLTLHEKLKICG